MGLLAADAPAELPKGDFVSDQPADRYSIDAAAKTGESEGTVRQRQRGRGGAAQRRNGPAARLGVSWAGASLGCPPRIGP